jgi:hypothetical protein
MKGSQLRVGTAFTNTMKEINDPAFSYVWFDFHAECKGMKYENLSKLIYRIKNQIDEYKYFTATCLRGFDEREKMTGAIRIHSD